MPHSPTVTLTEEHIAFYRANGFLAIDAITTQDEIDRLRGVYDTIFERRAGRDEGNQFDLAGSDEEGKAAALPQILNPRKYAPELATTLYEANARAIAEQLLGPEATFTGDHAIFKPAGSGAPTPWHQDEAYWDPGLHYRSLSVWMPLQEATLENGCMVFLPGSHQQEITPHQSIGGDPRVHGLEMVEAVDETRAVACPPAARRGDVSRLAHHALHRREPLCRAAPTFSASALPRPRAATVAASPGTRPSAPPAKNAASPQAQRTQNRARNRDDRCGNFILRHGAAALCSG